MRRPLSRSPTRGVLCSCGAHAMSSSPDDMPGAVPLPGSQRCGGGRCSASPRYQSARRHRATGGGTVAAARCGECELPRPVSSGEGRRCGEGARPGWLSAPGLEAVWLSASLCCNASLPHAPPPTPADRALVLSLTSLRHAHTTIAAVEQVKELLAGGADLTITGVVSPRTSLRVGLLLGVSLEPL